MPATLSELEQQNPNIRSQIQVWQRERTNNGQSPTDWSAFRQHAMAIGAPDPGQDTPGEFLESAASASAASAPAQQVQAPQQVQQAPQQVQPAPQQVQQPQYQQPQAQPQLTPEVLEAIKIKNDYEADKKTPTDKWLKARGMTQAALDAALRLAASVGAR